MKTDFDLLEDFLAFTYATEERRKCLACGCELSDEEAADDDCRLCSVCREDQEADDEQ